MRAIIAGFALLGLLSIVSTPGAQTIVFFEEEFNGPTLDAATWRTEILTSGPRWCQESYDYWGPGAWIDEGVECHEIAAHSPYGSATPDGWLHLSSTNPVSFPVVYSRLPGSVQLFPTIGDFSLTLRVRYDRLTPWGSGLVVFRAEDTEPSGTDLPHGEPGDAILHMGSDASSGELRVLTALGGSYDLVAVVPSAMATHEITVTWVGTSATILADGEVIYGPVTTSLRPTAIVMGNPPMAFWGPTDWTSWSLDVFRVEIPGTVSAAVESWGAVKARY